MKKLTIVSWEQFGYHTDNYNHALYLRESFDIQFICFDENLKKIELEGVEVKYIKNYKNKLLRRMIFNLRLYIYIYLFNPDVIFMRYFRSCSVFKKIFNNRKIVVDIRTACVDKNKEVRDKYNEKLSKECNKFDKITVISSGLIRELKLNPDKCKVLPLGAKSMINNIVEEKERLKLIYVGVFDSRRIDETIRAFNRFSDKYGATHEYTVIGFAYDKNEEDAILKSINQNRFNNIRYLGRIPNEHLGKYFENSNVGISYVPITEFFEYQPPTKTYEYLMNGIFTIATKTYENSLIINERNGILIEDNEDSIFNALELSLERLKTINRLEIQKTIESHSWSNICNKLKEDLINI